MAVLRHRGFALLWGGQLVSGLGDLVLFIALPFYVYARTGSALATGGIFVAETIPRFLGPLAGVLVDRWDRRQTMIWVDLFRAAALLPLLFLGRNSLWLLYVVGVVEAIASQLFTPASSALVPSLVPAAELTAANGAMSASMALTQLVGPPLGGALLALMGLSTVVVVDAVSFLASALSLLLVRPMPLPPAADPPASSGAFWSQLKEGALLIRRSRLLTGLILVLALTQVSNGVINVVLVPFVKRVLGLGAGEFGSLLSFQALGAIAGSLTVGLIATRVRPRLLISASFLLTGAVVFGFAQMRSFWPAAVLLLASGPIGIAGAIVIQSLLQLNVEDSHRGRVFGILESVLAVGTVLGMGGAALLTDRVGIVKMLQLDAGVFVVAAAAAWFWVKGPGVADLAQPATPATMESYPQPLVDPQLRHL